MQRCRVTDRIERTPEAQRKKECEQDIGGIYSWRWPLIEVAFFFVREMAGAKRIKSDFSTEKEQTSVRCEVVRFPQPHF